MKTISIDIPDKLYESIQIFLKSFNSSEIKIYAEDPDTLTVEEEREIYTLKAKSDKGEYSEFDDWDDIKVDL